MSYRLKVLALLFLGVITNCRSFSQTADSTKADAYRTWSVGVSGGISTPYTLIGYNSRQDFRSPDIELGYGFYVKKQFSYSFGIQADLMAGKLRADNSQLLSSADPHSYVYSSFNTKLNWSASLSGNFIIAHIKRKDHKGLIQPYLNLGAGLVNYSAALNTHFNPTTTSLSAASTYFIPVGAGIKFDLATDVNLDLGYQVNFTGSDNVDGYVYGQTNDRYSYTHIGLEFIIGKRSKPQLADRSPDVVLWERYLALDRISQNTIAEQQAQLQSITYQNSKLSNDLDVANASLAKLTLDSDGDGVPDVYDKCPNTPAGTPVDVSGCPLPDRPTKISLTDQDRQIVNAAGAILEFYPGKAIIREYSHVSLDRVAQLLIDKGLLLKLESYTDNTGDAEANLKLSRAQAEAVKGYLVSKGADPSHITAFGYGESHPIANNKTPAGRRLNRRVEFSLY